MTERHRRTAARSTSRNPCLNHQELLHHGAEIALLRDLHRARTA
ncbi:hypothetical protein [Streptomyces sp. NPDC046712]